MKNTNRLIGLGIAFLYLVFTAVMNAQNTYHYSLAEDFTATDSNAPELVVLSNNQGLSGAFVTTNAPPNLCPNDSETQAYQFADNGGLAFDNGDDLIGCEYTVDFVFNFQELPAVNIFDPQWSAVIRFNNQDDGIYIHRNILFQNIEFQVWDNNTILKAEPFPAFNIVDWFKMTIVRNCNGMVDFYINCEYYCSFNDAPHNLFLPSFLIILFQDDPTTLDIESSPGYTKDFQLSDFAKTSTEIAAECACICGTSVANCPIEITSFSTTCDEAQAGIYTQTLPSLQDCDCDTLLTTQVDWVMPDETYLEEFTCKQEEAGLLIDTLMNQNGCDSFVFVQTTLAVDTTFLTGTTCDVDAAGLQVNILANVEDCDSFVITNFTLLPSDTLYFFQTTCDENEAGININFLSNQFGCDSLIVNEISYEGIPEITNLNLIPDNGNASGSINPTIAGGAMPYTFLWNNGAITPSIDNLEAGIYALTVTDENGCENVFEFEVEMLNSLIELGLSGLQIFPNPVVSGEPVQLKLNSRKVMDLPVRIFDLTGKLVFENKYSVPIGKSHFYLEMPASTGIFMIEIGESGTYAERIIQLE